MRSKLYVFIFESNCICTQVMSMVRTDRSMTPTRVKMAASLNVLLDALESSEDVGITE
jgi:hypothetical protein